MINRSQKDQIPLYINKEKTWQPCVLRSKILYIKSTTFK